MRVKGSVTLLGFFVICNFAHAQVSDLSGEAFNIRPNSNIEIDVTPLFLSSGSYSEYLEQLPKTKLKSKITNDYSIGRVDSFFVRNILDQSKWYSTKAILIDKIENYAIWFEFNVYEELKQSDTLKDFKSEFREYLLERTDENSVDQSSGIIEILETYVGEFPNTDNDHIVDILYLDIIDHFESTGQFVAGFFDPVNLSLHEFSNKRDMVYMDVYPTLIENGSLNLKRSLSTLVHELQHLIHSGYEGSEIEDVFINEGFSEAVEILCGFPPRDPRPYLSNTNKSLLSWDFSNPISDYSRASLWTHYLVEQYGITILKDLIQNENTGLGGYDDSIKRFGGNGFEESFKFWGIANVINNIEVSNKFGYQHSLLDDLTMNNSGVSTQIPNVISGSIPPLAHSSIAIPYVRYLELQNSNVHNRDINITGIISYPDTEFDLVRPFSNDDDDYIITDINDFGTVEVLFSNISSKNDSTSGKLNILVNGEQSAIEKSIGYGDGINDTFYSNASFLRLSDKHQKVGIIIPNQKSDYWLKKINLSAVFDSELVGNSNLTNIERDFLISIYTFSNSTIGKPIIEGVLLRSKRESGQLIKEEFSLDVYFESLAHIEDSIAIVIENDLDDENYISVGLDYSDSNHGIVFDEHWLKLSEVNIGGNSLAGFTPNIQFDIIENGHQIISDDLIQSIEYNFEKVVVDVAIPLDFEESNVTLIAKLPDDSFHKFLPVSSTEYLFSFELPVQVGGNYTFQSVVSSSNLSVTITDEVEWAIDIPNGIKVGQNYPNPFNPVTSIPYTLIEDASVGWNVYNILGRSVLQIEPTIRLSGEHILELDLSNFASGVYFVRAVIDRERTGLKYTQPIKVLMIK